MMSRSISTVVWIFIKVQKCYKKFKLFNCYIPLSTFYRISTKGKDGSRHRTTTFDTSLESWDFNEKNLGTIGVPFGTQSVSINLRFGRSGWSRSGASNAECSGALQIFKALRNAPERSCSGALRSILNMEGHMTKNHPRICYIMFLTLFNFASDSKTHTVCC